MNTCVIVRKVTSPKTSECTAACATILFASHPTVGVLNKPNGYQLQLEEAGGRLKITPGVNKKNSKARIILSFIAKLLTKYFTNDLEELILLK